VNDKGGEEEERGGRSGEEAEEEARSEVEGD
jgi:hypothetical protein